MLEVDDPCFMMNEMARSAAAAGELGLLLSCIDMGAKPDSFDGEGGMTCLMLAARHAQLQCVRGLATMSNPLIVDHQGRDALIHAAMNGHSYCSNFLADMCDASVVAADGFSALCWACVKRDKALASFLLERSGCRTSGGLFKTRPIDLVRAQGWSDLEQRIIAMATAGRESRDLAATLAHSEGCGPALGAKGRL